MNFKLSMKIIFFAGQGEKQGFRNSAVTFQPFSKGYKGCKVHNICIEKIISKIAFPPFPPIL